MKQPEKKSQPARVFAAAFAAVLMAAAASCIQSLQPLFEDDDLIFDSRFLGVWTDSQGQDSWSFERGREKEYRLVCRSAEDDETARFVGRLGRLGGALFLDIFPEDKGNPRPRNEMLVLHLLPVHTLWRVRFEGEGLCLESMDPDWLKEQIDAGRAKIAHVRSGDRLVLTADTAALQAFFAGQAANDKAFPRSDSPLRRK